MALLHQPHNLQDSSALSIAVNLSGTVESMFGLISFFCKLIPCKLELHEAHVPRANINVR